MVRIQEYVVKFTQITYFTKFRELTLKKYLSESDSLANHYDWIKKKG